ncbi:putative amidase [Camellia lanceoleosa]|uniref:Amidase n=1 Tax=Camellia lanceoleosa TaxID=1840588 RepID=A0ACC0IJR4_9ERIC|nr:putative amidase [Camellia lanceoleosa]
MESTLRNGESVVDIEDKSGVGGGVRDTYREGSRVLAIGGYPGINVPAGYDEDGTPYGICFGGLRGSEPKLIEIAYGFEQASKVRKPPSFKP